MFQRLHIFLIDTKLKCDQEMESSSHNIVPPQVFPPDMSLLVQGMIGLTPVRDSSAEHYCDPSDIDRSTLLPYSSLFNYRTHHLLSILHLLIHCSCIGHEIDSLLLDRFRLSLKCKECCINLAGTNSVS